jgi:hypothetical protein
MMCRRSLLATTSISFVDTDEKTSAFTLSAEVIDEVSLPLSRGIKPPYPFDYTVVADRNLQRNYILSARLI